jgi:MFS family permease
LAENKKRDYSVYMATDNTNRLTSPSRHRTLLLYAAEAANSIAGMLITVGLPFFTSHRFGWGAGENFAIAASQGALYVIGALLAKGISKRWGRGRSLLWLYAGMTAFAIAVGICASMGRPVTTVVLVVIETGLMAASWPMLESLVSEAGVASQLSKRLGCYNIVWATTGAIAVAASGAIIQHTPAWAFLGIAAAGHFLGGVFIFCRARSAAFHFDDAKLAPSPVHSEPEHLNANQWTLDKAVVRSHRLALWLSRIALPSTYVVVYSLAPALPSLHAIKQLSPTIATLVASIWLIARAAAFAITGSTTFWHKRPGLMLWASVTMLFAFIGTAASGSLTEVNLAQALLAMAIAQILLGFSIGTIYSASLYFGMAVSDGSTEHGGYHEALIGLGQLLGPMVGATMQWIRPGALGPAVIAISVVISITVVIEAVVGVRISRGIDSPPYADH